jgi:hypothetical protein
MEAAGKRHKTIFSKATIHTVVFSIDAGAAWKGRPRIAILARQTNAPKLFQNPITYTATNEPQTKLIMQRYNSFNQIHKALRALLYDAALSLQQTDFSIKEECDAAIEKVVAILDLFEDHAHHEDNHILPAVFSFEPAVADVFEQEHVTDLELSRSLQLTVAELYRTTRAEEKIRLGKQLAIAFIQFMIFNLNHMAKEEEILNEILWRYYSDAEIKKIEAVIRQNTPAEKQPFVVKWMLRGISNSEAINWLKGLQQQLPAPVFNGILQLAETELPSARFQQIAAHFSEHSLLA